MSDIDKNIENIHNINNKKTVINHKIQNSNTKKIKNYQNYNLEEIQFGFLDYDSKNIRETEELENKLNTTSKLDKDDTKNKLNNIEDTEYSNKHTNMEEDILLLTDFTSEDDIEARENITNRKQDANTGMLAFICD